MAKGKHIEKNGYSELWLQIMFKFSFCLMLLTFDNLGGNITLHTDIGNNCYNR